MAKILFIGDTHFKNDNQHQTDALKNAVHGVLKKHQREIDIICLLGDVFDKEKTDSGVLNRVKAFVAVLASSKEVFILVGNHDYKNNSCFLTDDHILVALEDMANVRIIDHPFLASGVVFCPYIPSGRFIEALDTMRFDWKAQDLIVAHQEFANANFGTFISKHGDEWPLDYPMVISGHIHKYQRLQTNILYVGTPYEVGFGEGDEKTISLFDSETKEETRISLNIPRKITIELGIADIKALKIPEDNNHYRITISGDEEQILLFKKTKGFQKLNEKHKLIFKGSKTLKVRKNEQNLDFISFLKKSVESESVAINNVLQIVLEKMSTNANKT